MKLIFSFVFLFFVNISISQSYRDHLWDQVNHYRLLGDYSLAITYMDSILLQGDNVSKNLLYRGSLKQWAGMHQDAIADFDKAIKINPDFTYTFVQRGLSHLELEDYNSAIDDFTLGLGRNGWQDSIAFRYRARAYHSKHEYQNAISDYDSALRYSPRDVNLLTNKATAYMALGDNDRALDLLEESIAIEPNYIEAIKQRTLLLDNDHQNLERLLKVALEYYKYHPDDHHNNLNIGYLYARLRHPERALRYLNKVDGKLADTYECYFNKGLAYFYLLDNVRAINYFEKAIKKQPNIGIPYVYLADCYKDIGEHSKACNSLDKASELGIIGAEDLKIELCK